MMSAPGSCGPAYVKLHWPFASVVHEPDALVEPLVEKRTVAAGTGCAVDEVTVAVTVWVVPTLLTASGGVRVTFAGVGLTGSTPFESVNVCANWVPALPEQQADVK
jgi:hypothetical protein